MAQSPYGPYWKDGMQNGYQDVGSWTFFKSTDPDRLAAAWLYAQFVTSKTVSLKKSITGLTFIRDKSEEHTSELQSLMRISYAVFWLKKTNYVTATQFVLVIVNHKPYYIDQLSQQNTITTIPSTIINSTYSIIICPII